MVHAEKSSVSWDPFSSSEEAEIKQTYSYLTTIMTDTSNKEYGASIQHLKDRLPVIPSNDFASVRRSKWSKKRESCPNRSCSRTFAH